MKKVLMGHEEQSTINTTMDQSNELVHMDIGSSAHISNENLVRKILFKIFLFNYY
jgi:predicted RNase H-related nuclease YkuK (DUF458 family)